MSPNENGHRQSVRNSHFAALAAEIDHVAARPGRERGGRPPFLTQSMVRALLVQQLFTSATRQMEFQLLERLSFRRFVGLRQSSQIPGPHDDVDAEGTAGIRWRE